MSGLSLLYLYCLFIYKFQTINRDGAHTQFKQYCDSELFPSFLKATSTEAEVNELISKVGFMLPPTYSVIGYERNVTMLWNYSCSLSSKQDLELLIVKTMHFR